MSIPQESGEREAEIISLMRERDLAEHYADKLASIILNEPINWACHEAKWQEAVKAAEYYMDDRKDLWTKLESIRNQLRQQGIITPLFYKGQSNDKPTL